MLRSACTPRSASSGRRSARTGTARSLVILEAPKVGAPALLRLRRASATFEQMLAGCFEHALDVEPAAGAGDPRHRRRSARGDVELPARGHRRRRRRSVAEEMFRWTLLFQTPAAKQLAERLSERARAALAQGRKAPHGPSAHGNGRDGERRARAPARARAATGRGGGLPRAERTADRRRGGRVDRRVLRAVRRQGGVLPGGAGHARRAADGARGRPGAALGRLAAGGAPRRSAS